MDDIQGLAGYAAGPCLRDKAAMRSSRLQEGSLSGMGCRDCPRNCNIDREFDVGFCGEGNNIRIARAALHMWEEPCISGAEGSGAVFFTGCNLRCVFCQNHNISTGRVGDEISIDRLVQIFFELEYQGANNINLVTATHFARPVAKAIAMAKDQGFSLPFIYNCGGYESVETLKRLDGLVDIYLPDFKYLDEKHAASYSKAVDYPKVAKLALDEMYRQVKRPVFDERGIMQKGMIVRHLLLPECLLDARHIVKYLYETFGDNIYISLMNQYTPLPHLDEERFPNLTHKVRRASYEKLVDYAISLGVTHAFIQEGETAKESFIPEFSLEGVHQSVQIGSNHLC